MDLERYKRQIQIEDIGINGQQKLLNSSVLIVGFGGLGNSVAMYLSRMGIGRMGIIDCDIVDKSNLPRQILFNETDVGKSKVLSGVDKLRTINSSLIIDVYDYRLNEQNALSITSDYDLVIDCTDNYSTRKIINRSCIYSSVPCVFGAVNEMFGYVSSYKDCSTACYECFMGEVESGNKNTNPIGVVGAMVGLISTIQCVEAIKILLNIGQISFNELIMIDGYTMEINKIPVNIREDCFCRGAYEKNNN